MLTPTRRGFIGWLVGLVALLLGDDRSRAGTDDDWSLFADELGLWEYRDPWGRINLGYVIRADNTTTWIGLTGRMAGQWMTFSDEHPPDNPCFRRYRRRVRWTRRPDGPGLWVVVSDTMQWLPHVLRLENFESDGKSVLVVTPSSCRGLFRPAPFFIGDRPGAWYGRLEP